MNNWTQDKLATQEHSRNDVDGGKSWKRLRVTQRKSKPSWKRFGEGSECTKINAVIGQDGVPVIEFRVSETAFASKMVGEKRDVTKEVYTVIYGSAALELFEMLREVFEPEMKCDG